MKKKSRLNLPERTSGRLGGPRLEFCRCWGRGCARTCRLSIAAIYALAC